MFYSDSIRAIAETAAKKVAFWRENPVGYLVAAMLAGAYVGVGVLLDFVIGGPLSLEKSPLMKIFMGGSFAIALSLVVFAGAELFTGNNLVMAIGWWRGKNTGGQMLAIWMLSWVGNLIGAALLAVLLYYANVLNPNEHVATQQASYLLVQDFAAKKMHLDPVTLLVRGALCNWLVCLGTWCSYRMQTEIGKLVMIFWCLYAFVAAGFEHSVANMTLLTLALLQPHAETISIAGMGYNLLWASVGNIIGGAIFVGAAYWSASHLVRQERAAEKAGLTLVG